MHVTTIIKLFDSGFHLGQVPPLFLGLHAVDEACCRWPGILQEMRHPREANLMTPAKNHMSQLEHISVFLVELSEETIVLTKNVL